MTSKSVVKFTGNFERNLADIEGFLIEAKAPGAFDALLDELLDTVIPNLERFPGMGRTFFSRIPHSVETTHGVEALREKLSTLTSDLAGLREYVMDDYLVLYAQIGEDVHLLAIKHHRQLSFDFAAQWRGA